MKQSRFSGSWIMQPLVGIETGLGVVEVFPDVRITIQI